MEKQIRNSQKRPGISPEWGSVADAAIISGLSTPTIFRALRAGTCFRSVKAGVAHNARRLIHLESFRAWVNSGARVPSGTPRRVSATARIMPREGA